jgi:hypothetical protein
MVGAKPTLNDPPNLLDSSKDYIIPALGNDAIVFAIQAPRIGLGLGLLGHFAEARAGVFADVVNSFGLTVGSATALVPCQSLSWTAAAHVGGELTFKVLDGIDLNLTKQATVLTKTQSWALPDIAACKPTP